MLSEHGIQIDQAAVDEILESADVLVVGFTLFPERLLVDCRRNDETGPMVAVVEPLGGVQERYHWLGQHRGMFGMPDSFSFFAWPHTIRSLDERDVLAKLKVRLAATSSDGVQLLDRALGKLREMENVAFRQAVAGEGPWKTLWQAA
jgi:hypothetical protein